MGKRYVPPFENQNNLGNTSVTHGNYRKALQTHYYVTQVLLHIPAHLMNIYMKSTIIS
jgi:hypothetical protein